MTLRRVWGVAAAAALALGLVACVPAPAEPATSPAPAVAPSPAASPSPAAPDAASDVITFVSVVDGDTVVTSAGTVRIAGIDTPETGQCGHDEASMAIGRLLAPGDPVTLVRTPGQNDRDHYDRLIRHVITEDGVDIGLMQLEAGNAVARYDSRDGYPAHPHEATYHAAQQATLSPDGTVITIGCRADASTAPVPFVPTTPPPAAPSAGPEKSPWWMQYSSCTKLKKNTVGHPTGPFDRDDPAEVDIYNWFAYGTGNRGDGDGDGLACE